MQRSCRKVRFEGRGKDRIAIVRGDDVESGSVRAQREAASAAKQINDFQGVGEQLSRGLIGIVQRHTATIVDCRKARKKNARVFAKREPPLCGSQANRNIRLAQPLKLAPDCELNDRL